MITLHSCYVRDFDKTWTIEPSVSQYNVLILATLGSLVYWVNGETYSIHKGDVLFIPAGSMRGGRTDEFHQRYATHFSMQDNTASLPILNNKQPCQITLESFDYFKHRFSMLNHHWLMKGPYLATTCYAVLLEMFSILNYDMDHWKMSLKKRKLVDDLKRYILDHYKEPITLKDLAEYADRTPNHISYTFKAVTGFSPIEYVHYVKISKAKD